MKRKVKILKAKGGADAATESFGKSSGYSGSSRPDPKGGFDLSSGQGPTFGGAPATTGGGGNKTINNTTQKTVKTNVTNNTNQTKKTGSASPFLSVQILSDIANKVNKYTRTQKVRGENIFGKPVDLPASRDYYRTYGKPIDVMSKEGVDYMKKAGLIKPTKTVGNGGGDNSPQLCPDGTYPPCKTPVTQVKNPVTKKNPFLSGFKAYDDGGEVVISSNVDKDLL
jgi:hypothetical protein